MKNTLIVAAMLSVATICVISTVDHARADDDKVSIKKVMKSAMKDGLCKKVASGKAEDGDAAQLLELFTAMSKLDPPRGDADSWKSKTDALVAAAQDCVDGKEGATKKLAAAANCKACHGAHKPPKN